MSKEVVCSKSSRRRRGICVCINEKYMNKKGKFSDERKITDRKGSGHRHKVNKDTNNKVNKNTKDKVNKDRKNRSTPKTVTTPKNKIKPVSTRKPYGKVDMREKITNRFKEIGKEGARIVFETVVRQGTAMVFEKIFYSDGTTEKPKIADSESKQAIEEMQQGLENVDGMKVSYEKVLLEGDTVERIVKITTYPDGKQDQIIIDREGA